MLKHEIKVQAWLIPSLFPPSVVPCLFLRKKVSQTIGLLRLSSTHSNSSDTFTLNTYLTIWSWMWKLYQVKAWKRCGRKTFRILHLGSFTTIISKNISEFMYPLLFYKSVDNRNQMRFLKLICFLSMCITQW